MSTPDDCHNAKTDHEYIKIFRSKQIACYQKNDTNQPYRHQGEM